MANCKICGKEIREPEKYCEDCWSAQISPVVKGIPGRDLPVRTMREKWFGGKPMERRYTRACPSCGFNNKPGATYCEECETSLLSRVKCPSCGTWQDAGGELCCECLSPLKDPVARWENPKELGPIVGSLAVAGMIVVGIFGILRVLGGVGDAFIAPYLDKSGSTIIFMILGLMVIAIGLAMGLFIEKHGWLTGFLLAFSVLFITIPLVVYKLWRFYLWTAGGNYNEAWIYVPIALGSGLILGLLGSLAGKKFKFPRFSLKKPLFSFIAPVVLCLIVALAIPLLHAPPKVLKYPEWGFEVRKPREYEVTEEISYSAKVDYLYRVILDTPPSSATLGDPYVRIYVTDRVFVPQMSDPIFGEQSSDSAESSESDEQTVYRVSEFNTREECYEAVLKKCEYESLEDTDDTCDERYLDLEVDGIPAIGYYCYKPGWLTEGAVFVYKRPYLYELWFENLSNDDLDITEEFFYEILDSFKFI